MSLLENLTKGRAFLAANAWCQGNYRAPCPDGGYAYCAQGALWHGVFETEYMDTSRTADANEAWSQYRQARNALSDLSPTWDGFGPSLVAFNDAQGRMKEEVLALFDQAIENAKGES